MHMASEVIFKGVRLLVKQGDVTEEKVDAIVTPANTKGIMGGGVDLAIKQKGGEQIERDAMAAAPIFIGRAVGTTAGKLPARMVIHAPTVQEPGFKSDAKSVDKATRAALGVAKESYARVIAMPAMGTGSGGVSKHEAAQVMVFAIKYFLIALEGQHPIKEIRLITHSGEMEKVFEEALATLAPKA